MLNQRIFLAILSLLACSSSITNGEKHSLSLHRSLQNETTITELDHNDTNTMEQDDHDHDHDEDHDHDHDHDHEETSESNLLEGSSTTSKPWGETILAAFLINIVTLVGVFFLSGEFVAKRVFKRDISQSPYYLAFTRNVIPSFACGALLATTVFLVLPEAQHLISAHFMGDEASHGHRALEENGEGQAAWRFGACIITGFLLPIVTDAFFPHTLDTTGQLETKQEPSNVHSPVDKNTDMNQDVPDESDRGIASDDSSPDNKVICDRTNKSVASGDDSDLVVVVADKVLPHSIDWSLTLSIFAGDFFHNFAGTR